MGQRLIDANALEDRAYEIYVHASPEFKTRMNTLRALIDSAPTIDAIPVVHGRWKKHFFSHRVDTYGNPDIGVECSECEFRWYSVHDSKYYFRYCPNCGAKMDAKDIDVPAKDGGAEC